MERYLYLLLCLLTWSCEKNPTPSNLIAIRDVKNSLIDYTSSVIQFSIIGNVKRAGIMYGTEQNFSNAKIQYAEKANGNISVQLKDLNRGTKYYYKVFVEDKKENKICGEIKSFQTEDFGISISVIETDFDGESVEFELNAPNIDWTIYTTQNWITVSPNKGSNSSLIKVHIDPIEIPYERKDSIHIKNISTNSIQTIPIIQKSKNKISKQITLSIPGRSFGEEGGTDFFVVNSNTTWSVSSNKKWCKISTNSGKNQQLVFYSLEPLENMDEQRTAIITIRSNDEVQYFTACQKSYNPHIVLRGNLLDIYDNGSYNIYGRIKAPNSWTISSTEQWYQFEKQSGFGDEEKVWSHIEANNTYQDRGTTNILKSDNITVKQYIIQRGMKEITQMEIPDIEMIYVQGGSFMMGNNANDECKPVHKVTLDDFYIGKYEVTQYLWEAVMGNNFSDYIGYNLPVTNISRTQANEFIDKLNSLTGRKYRLPTEAEWEYAAKGGQKSMNYLYSGSNSIEEVCNVSYANASIAFVGSKKPNELGIFDMTGNVSEYCSDWYGPYSSGDKNNPTGPAIGDKIVVRGEYLNYVTNSDRSWGYPDISSYKCGFRLVLDK